MANQSCLKTIPEWKDTNLATSERTAIRDHAINDLGFTAQEVDKVYDYRFVKVLRNSLLHSKTMKASKKNQNRKPLLEWADQVQLPKEKRQHL